MLNFFVTVLTLSAITALLALGLNARWGWVGDLDIAYYLFVAIGAYVGGVVQIGPAPALAQGTWILGFHLPFLLALIVGTAAGALCALIVGSVALFRLRGDYFAITTLAVALIAIAVISQEPNIFDGFNGIFGVPQPFGAQVNLGYYNYQWFFLGLVVVFLVVVYAILSLLYRSSFGRALRAIREDEVAAAAFGVNVYAGKLKAYVIGGAVAALGGVLYVSYLSTWNPSVWAPAETFLLYAGIFIGGQGNSLGVVIGAILAGVAIPEATQFLPQIPGHADLGPALDLMLVGILLLLVLRLRPQGILPERRPRDRPAGDLIHTDGSVGTGIDA